MKHLTRSSSLQGDLFRHVSAHKAAPDRAVMDCFAPAKRQFRLHLRPDEVLAEGTWATPAPRIEELRAALAQLTEWGNLESQPDTACVTAWATSNAAHFLYRQSCTDGLPAAAQRTLLGQLAQAGAWLQIHAAQAVSAHRCAALAACARGRWA